MKSKPKRKGKCKSALNRAGMVNTGQFDSSHVDVHHGGQAMDTNVIHADPIPPASNPTPVDVTPSTGTPGGYSVDHSTVTAGGYDVGHSTGTAGSNASSATTPKRGVSRQQKKKQVALKAKEAVDILAEVPTDSKGCYLEAATDESGFVIDSAKTASATTYPVEDGREIGIRETVQVQPGGAITFYTNGPSGSQVTIALERVPGSGGHNHGGATTDAAAVGTISPNSFTLPNGYPQNVQSVFRAPTVCGAVRYIVRFSTNNPSVENLIEILFQGFQAIPSSTNLRLKTPTTEHPSPYWATPDFINKLVQLANLYAKQTSKPLTVTDASLPWGGCFDLDKNWASPHHEHMNGRQADIRSSEMSPSEKQTFLQAATQAGLSASEESKPLHWHVRG
ncbi:MAG: hypothetical protein ABSG99_05195 [Sedimentisphaerales bacterium]